MSAYVPRPFCLTFTGEAITRQLAGGYRLVMASEGNAIKYTDEARDRAIYRATNPFRPLLVISHARRARFQCDGYWVLAASVVQAHGELSCTNPDEVVAFVRSMAVVMDRHLRKEPGYEFTMDRFAAAMLEDTFPTLLGIIMRCISDERVELASLQKAILEHRLTITPPEAIPLPTKSEDEREEDLM